MAANVAVPETKTLILRDGRTLAYTEVGDPHGQPVIVAQGTPGSRLLRHPNDEIAERLGMRLVTPDRPGYGLSTYRRGCTLLTWADDVAQLADALGFDQFAVVGYSGGGPYALACAYALPTRVRRVALLASMAPLADPAVRSALRAAGERSWLQAWVLFRLLPQPGVLLLSTREGRAFRKDPARLLSQLAKQIPEVDRMVPFEPAFYQMCLGAFSEAFRQGARGYVADLKLFTRPLGIDIAAITAPISLWQGEVDRNVPAVMGRYYAEALPNCSATFLPTEGHISLFANHWGEVLTDLKEATPPPPAPERP